MTTNIRYRSGTKTTSKRTYKYIKGKNVQKLCTVFFIKLYLFEKGVNLIRVQIKHNIKSNQDRPKDCRSLQGANPS